MSSAMYVRDFFKKSSTLVLILMLFVFVSSTKAQTAPAVHITFSPSDFTYNASDQFASVMSLDVADEAFGISGFDICLSYNPSHLAITSFEEPIDISTGDSSKFQKLKNDIDSENGKSCIAYISILPDDQLARHVRIPITLSGVGAGQGTIMVEKAQIVGSIEGDEFTAAPSAITYSIEGSVASPTAEVKEMGLFSRFIAFLKRILPFI